MLILSGGSLLRGGDGRNKGGILDGECWGGDGRGIRGRIVTLMNGFLIDLITT